MFSIKDAIKIVILYSWKLFY